MFGGPVEQGVAPDDETEFRGEPRARPAAQLQHDREQGLLQPARLAGMGGNVGQPLAEDLALAGGLVAEEAPRADAQDDRGAAPGQVGDRASVDAVRPGGVLPARGATGPARAGTGPENDPLGLDADEFEQEPFRY
jgi:hypothetical protein